MSTAIAVRFDAGAALGTLNTPDPPDPPGASGVPDRGAGCSGRRRDGTATRPARPRRAVVIGAVLVLAVLAVLTGAAGAISSPVAVTAPAAPVAVPAAVEVPGSVVAAPGAPGDCGFFDPAACVTDAINSLIADAVTSALDAGLRLLSATLLATPRVDQVPRVAELWASSWQLVLALYAMIVVLAAIGVMVAGVRGQTSAREVLPRLAVGFIAGALSLPLSGIAITLANALSAGVLGEGLDPASVVNGFGALLGSLLSTPGGGGLGLIGLGVGLLVVIQLGAVLLAFVARVVLTVLLVIGAPLALMFHALPQTEGIARWWWRAFGGVLAVQVLQSLILVTSLRVVLGPGGLAAVLFPGPDSAGDVAGGLVNALVLLVLLWLLWRIPFWVLHAVRGSHGQRRGFVGSAVRTAVVAAAFTALGGPAGLGAAAAGRGGLGRLAGLFAGRAAGRGLAGLLTGTGARGNGRGSGSGGAGGPAADPDPYARVETERDGQLRLPLGPLRRVPRSSSRPTPHGGNGPGRPGGPGGPGRPGAAGAAGAAGTGRPSGGAAPRGRQLLFKLPFDEPQPDPFRGNRPVGGQYPLPFDGLVRQPRPARPAAPAAAPAPARGRRPARGVQLELPLDPFRGNRPLRGGENPGQYPLPLGVTRQPPPPPPPPAAAPARPPRRAGRVPVQPELPFDPYQDPRPLRGGQYPLPFDVTRRPRPAPPPAPAPAPLPAPAPPATPAPPPASATPAPPPASRRPRSRQLPLPLKPPPRRRRR